MLKMDIKVLRLSIFLTLCLTLSACVSKQTKLSMVGQKAAEDLNCEQKAIDLRQEANNTFAASGCEQEQRYILKCLTDHRHSRFTMKTSECRVLTVNEPEQDDRSEG